MHSVFLLPFTPKFLSTPKLEGTVDPTKPDSTIVYPGADSKGMWCFLFFLILVCERLTVIFGISTEHGVGEPFVWVLEVKFPGR